ncbi:MAG: polysaccharide pyruvyl transferase family protein [Candidatus Brocadia sp.]|nr:MAG: polysaccharide pyruvyl transferase family protein [Candidatus Brocadia sp.]
MTSILLINDTSDQNNWGCQATTSALKGLLADHVANLELKTITLGQIRKQFRAYKSYPFGSNKRVFEWFSGNDHENTKGTKLIRKIKASSSVPIEFFPSVSDEFDDIARAWIKGQGGPVGRETLEKIKSSDVVILNGEGAMFSNTLKGQRPLFLMYLAKKYFGKPSFIINHSAHFMTSTPLLLSMARTVYPLMDMVLVREPYSSRNLQNLVGVEPEVVPDAIFSLRFDSSVPDFVQELKNLNSEYVCIGATSLAGVTSWKPYDAYCKLINKMKNLGFNVVLIAKDKADMFLKDIVKSTDASFFGPDRSFFDLYQLLKGSRLYISGRYHPMILASMAGCPFVPLNANMHKIEGLCELLEYPIRQTFDYFRLSSEIDDIIQVSETLLNAYEETSSKLKIYSEKFSLSSKRNITVIDTYLNWGRQ